MTRKHVIGAVAVLISLPAVLAAIEAISFRVHNRNNGSILSSGERREYQLYVPRSYDRSRPVPLVISMHGAGGWPVQQMELTAWNRLADREGFIVVYPSALVGEGPAVWHVGAGPRLTRDVRFIAALIDKLEASYNIDPARIYADGFSNGGGMAFVLSCTLADRIAAVGMVGSAQTMPWSACAERRAVPMMVIHGTADHIALYEGGTSWLVSHLPPIPRWTATWARRNQCEPKPVESSVAADVVRREYVHCADDASVVLLTIREGGHTWPGGRPLPEWFVGPTSRSIDATRELWTFFSAHPLAKR
jgi:polyhydroxybutyrate depolymerase